MIAPLRKTADFHLSKEARTSPVWAEVLTHLNRMLDGKRTDLENPELTDVETATLRGHIQMLKAFIVLGNEPPPEVAPVARTRPRGDLGAMYG